MRIHSFLASSDYLSCPHWTSPFALLPHTRRTHTQRKQTLWLSLGDLIECVCGGSLGMGQEQIREELHRYGKGTGSGVIGASRVGSLANLRQTGKPGCLSGALYQLSSTWQSQEGLRDVLVRIGLTRERDEADASITPAPQDSAVSQ